MTYIIEKTISNAINNAEPPRNDNRNIETTKKNGTESNNDKEKNKVNNPNRTRSEFIFWEIA